MTDSTMWLDKNSHVEFINNTAQQVGGAIWIINEPTNEPIAFNQLNYPSCFYQLTFNDQEFTRLVKFQDNNAKLGGDNIFGAALHSNCRMTPNRRNGSYEVFNKIFEFRTDSLSSVSSSPKRVCMCEDGRPQCTKKMDLYDSMYQPYYHNVIVTPGERFTLSLAVVGNDFGVVTGGVYALDRSGEDVDFLFTPGDKLQQITNLQCRDLNYSVYPKNNKTSYEMILGLDSISTASQRILFQNYSYNIYQYNSDVNQYTTTNEITYFILNVPVFVKIAILPCALGTSLPTDTYSSCQCQPGLDSFVESCLIINNTAMLYRNGTHWIGTVPENTSTLLANKFCLLDYCKTEQIPVLLLDDQDAQCTLNRSGVLCGGCPSDLSLAIGSSRCIQCDNNNGLALLLFFIIAGVVLILCIKLLDITVAQGAINGLIFYANIIWIHQGIYFPLPREEDNQHFWNFYSSLKVFIAWLNLDFGIETCFFQGLDAYGKTWLQFVFPVYLWVLAILIIVLCSYSTRATKIFGYNTVTVLSTLFLLSYTKIQRTIVLIVAPAELTQFNPSGTRVTWRLDSNLDYGKEPHVFLFIVGVVAYILLCVPFTLALLFVRPLQKLSCCAPSARQSLIDSFTGPLKAKHHYWVGLTLLVRSLLAITAGALEGIDASVALVLVGVSCALLCLFVFHVYRNLFLSLLESVFIINLVVLSFVYLARSEPQTRVTCTCISAAISFLLFVGIIVYHVCLIIHKFYDKNKQKLNLGKPLSPPSIVDTPQTTTWVDMREELLESKPAAPI